MHELSPSQLLQENIHENEIQNWLYISYNRETQMGGEIIIKMDAKVTTMLIKCRVTNVTVRENVSVTML